MRRYKQSSKYTVGAQEMRAKSGDRTEISLMRTHEQAQRRICPINKRPQVQVRRTAMSKSTLG